ncbi:hypothetical protein [Granulicella aggregans]|uniref:hypothetical protein n=1 Tax=Granulicella aggregans TaxID=474949 RepID=UPI0021E03141|nr:hypothetical protein [Granulicella aggregans]
MNARFAPPLRLILVSLLGLATVPAHGQEPPYFVTYSHVMEEPGNLEVASQNIGASPKNANAFYGQTIELEYGVTAWYTAEVYFQGQTTLKDSTVFTGWRLENRFRPLRNEHWINPVIYVEYEDINNADKSFLEITGHHVISDQAIANGLLRSDVERSIEGKLILSSNFKGVNVSENIIAEKNVSNEPWEFGYAIGGSHSLASHASASNCRFCRQYFAVGGELFGGLGTRYDFGFKSTSIYAGPTVAYNSPHSYTITAGPEFGLNANSAAVLWRLKASYEFQQVRDLFRRNR